MLDNILGYNRTTWATGILILFVSYVLLRYLRAASRRILPCPPGPPMRPFIGNIMDIRVDKPWLKLTDYKYKYGDLVYFQGLGQSMLVLNSLQAMTDLLEKRASKYSDRPIFIFGNELMGLNRYLTFCDYNDEWRAQRKLAHTALSPTAVKGYHVMQEDSAAIFARDLLRAPENFNPLMRLTSSKIILAITYGIPMDTPEDKYITQIEELAKVGVKAVMPGTYLVDLLPILKYAPSWVPFQREAKWAWDMTELAIARPFEYVKRELEAGTAPPSFVQQLLTDPLDDIADFERRVKWAAGSMYGAGAESTYVTVIIFFLVMALYPDKQRIAQAEVDRIVGTDRLPTIEDRSCLPYVNALIKETMRWHPIMPLGVAHRSSEDDEYEGYFIPKSTVVIPNVWSIAFEPNEKYEPQAFLPERFLDPSHPTVDPSMWMFGFGRRICPGSVLAENSIFITIATLLASFDISLPDTGELKPQFSSFQISYPEPFDCRIVPRSGLKASIIEARAAQSTI
ncbi:cytochrome P450 [Obba rivulosa]|uniref:Cytochrome P450 n=1 Tax=Obba rivulosa TaxID=1052685 RepID=A0A8E2DN36_9APHY|nr:cytochrome P450 [Obba rivulosa]